MPPRKTKSLKASEGIAPTVAVKHDPKPKAAYRAVNRIAYSPELAARICEELLERDTDDKTRSLRDVCRIEGMPKERTVYEWLVAEADFAQMYARARETLADMNANDILTISDTATDANLARLRIDARKWWAAKVAPKKYGETTQRVEIGKPGEFAELEDMSDAELADIARGRSVGAAAEASS